VQDSSSNLLGDLNKIKIKKSMGRVFGIGCLHLGHENMANKRGFANSAEHDENLISNWNSVVNKKDIVCIFGDVTMEKKKYYPLLDRMNGIKKVILGNHDRWQDVKELLKYVDGVAGMINYKGAILTHCPVHPSELDYRYKLNIHAHVHENTLDDDRYINLSAENINFTPVLLSEYVDNDKNTEYE
jgi:calcineurin-like phosphoesterase family protein